MRRASRAAGESAPPASFDGLRVFALLITLSTLAAYVAIWRLGTTAESLFRGLGAEAPWVTRVAVALHAYVGVLALIAVIPCVRLVAGSDLTHAQRRRHYGLVVAGMAIALLMLGIYVVAIYAPVFSTEGLA